MSVARRTSESAQGSVSSADRKTARDLVSMLGDRHARDRFELRGKDGRTTILSAPMLSLIEQAARIVAQGTAVDVLARDKELTSQEAAALLGVSRQYLIRVLDRGDMPFTLTGNHRRIRSADVLDYITLRDANRRTALAELTQDTQQAGGYESPATLGPRRPR